LSRIRRKLPQVAPEQVQRLRVHTA
jgi:hypothetical protein